MTYFKNFPLTGYKFGNNSESTFFQNVSVYADLIDNITDEISFYQEYTILDGERPDTLSWRLYGTPDYYWTFYLINPELREGDWPRSFSDLSDVTANIYPGVEMKYSDISLISATPGAPSTQQEVFDWFDPANNYTITVDLVPSSPYLNVSFRPRRSHDLGQVFLEPYSVKFNTRDPYRQFEPDIYKPGDTASIETTLDEEIIGSTFKNRIHDDLPVSPVVLSNGVSFTMTSLPLIEDSIHHFVNSDNEWADPTYTSQLTYTTLGLAPVTYLEHVTEQNDLRKNIRIFKPSSIEKVVSEFQRIIKS